MREIQVFETDEGAFIATRREADPSITDLVVDLAGGGAGNVNNGVHSYLVTFQTEDGETTFTPEDLGLQSVTVVDKTSDGKVALSEIPVGSASVLARRIWRTKADADPDLLGNYFLVASIDDNTATTYTDNTADSGLGGVGHDETVPAANTAVNQLTLVKIDAAATHITAASTAHALNATFSDTEVEDALDALGTKLNAVISALEAAGIMAAS